MMKWKNYNTEKGGKKNCFKLFSLIFNLVHSTNFTLPLFLEEPVFSIYIYLYIN